MLRWVLAHQGSTAAPHHLWGAWNPDPLILVGLTLAAGAYARGRPVVARPGAAPFRSTAFVAALVVFAVALVSPLEALAGSLVSAHMVQHVLLLLVTSPLLALSRPWARLMRGSPPLVRGAGARWRRRLDCAPVLRALRRPSVVWMVHVAAIWLWHAAVPYEAARRSHGLHALEHASFLVTGVAFWSVILGPRHRNQGSPGSGILAIFAMAMQSVFLSALLTFAESPWYPAYATSTAAWGLDPLADQQLAGVIMWVPAGAVYLIAALALLASWITERSAPLPEVHPESLE